MKVFQIENITIYNEDFLKLELKKDSIDCVITSPPYNIGIDYGKYDDNKTYKDYLEFTKKWMTKCFTLLKEDGGICINVPIDTGKNGKRSLAADLTVIAKRVGFKYKGTIVWNKQNVRNKHSMVFSKNLEVILIFYKEEWKPVSKEYKELVNEIWTFSGESSKRVGHPAPFPVEIPRRLIKLFTTQNEIILDPFLGSGTTVIASMLSRREGIGVEIEKKYFEISRNRVEKKKW